MLDHLSFINSIQRVRTVDNINLGLFSGKIVIRSFWWHKIALKLKRI